MLEAVIAGVDGTELERTDASPVDEECECVLCLGGAAVNATLLTERNLDGPGDAARSFATVSKSGGGSERSRRDDDAKAMASAPYGTPNLVKVSLEEITLSCSAVGPVLG